MVNAPLTVVVAVAVAVLAHAAWHCWFGMETMAMNYYTEIRGLMAEGRSLAPGDRWTGATCLAARSAPDREGNSDAPSRERSIPWT